MMKMMMNLNGVERIVGLHNQFHSYLQQLVVLLEEFPPLGIIQLLVVLLLVQLHALPLSIIVHDVVALLLVKALLLKSVTILVKLVPRVTIIAAAQITYCFQFQNCFFVAIIIAIVVAIIIDVEQLLGESNFIAILPGGLGVEHLVELVFVIQIPALVMVAIDGQLIIFEVVVDDVIVVQITQHCEAGFDRFFGNQQSYFVSLVA